MRARLPVQDQARGLGPGPVAGVRPHLARERHVPRGQHGDVAALARDSGAVHRPLGGVQNRRRARRGGHRDHPRRGGGRAAEPLRRRDDGPARASAGAGRARGVLRGRLREARRRRARRAVSSPERGHARGGEGRGRRAAAAGGDAAPAAAARDAAEAADAAAAHVDQLKAAGAAPAAVAEAEARRESLKDKAARALKGLFGGDGGARGRVQAFREALKEVERAEWRQELHERWEGKERQRFQRGCAKCIDGCICCCSFVGRKIQNQAASPADARRRCEEARKAVADHAAEASPDGGSAIVIFSSLESAQAAATCPLGAPGAATEVSKPTYREDKPHRAGSAQPP